MVPYTPKNEHFEYFPRAVEREIRKTQIKDHDLLKKYLVWRLSFEALKKLKTKPLLFYAYRIFFQANQSKFDKRQPFES